MPQRTALCGSLLLVLPAVAAARGDSARGPTSRTWHANGADIRFPLTVSRSWSLPHDDYLVDLKPVEVNGLKLDPKMKSISGRGSVVYAVRPAHRWITYSHKGGSTRILADGKEIGKSHAWSRKTASVKLAIPRGTKKIKLEVRANLNAPGFTLGPRVARAQVHFPGGMNSADFKPLAYTAGGRRVACRLVRAGDGEPMTVLFDCSSGETRYLLYPVGARHRVTPLKWVPPAGLIQETRYLEEYDAAVETYEGFINLWKRARHVAGRKLVDSPQMTRLPAFPPLNDDPHAPRGSPLVLSQLKGVFSVYANGPARFYLRFRAGGYLLIDGQLFINAGSRDRKKREDQPEGRFKAGEGGKEIALSKGLHTYQMYLYGEHGHYGGFSTYGTPWQHSPRFILPAPTSAGAPEVRDVKKRLLSVVWPEPFDAPGVLQAWGKWPACRMGKWPLTARLTGGEEGVTFRWRFPRGRVVTGKTVHHTFFESGIHPVAVKALRSGDQGVLASSTVRVKVFFDWVRGNYGYGRFDGELRERAAEFDGAMPVEHVLNIHAWAAQNHRRPMQALTSRAIDKRIDEVLKLRANNPDYLLWLAGLLSVPPASAHDSAAKALRAVYDKMEPGSLKRREAALALCDLLTDVYGKPDEALKLIEEVGGQKDAVSLNTGWQLAWDKGYYHHPRRVDPGQIAGKLKWEEIQLGFGERSWERPWLRRRLDLEGRDNRRSLFLDLGSMYANGMIYFNNQPLCEPWECLDGVLAVPPKVLREGENELVIHFRHPGQSPRHAYYALQGPGEDRLDREFELAKARALLAKDRFEEAGGLLKAQVMKGAVARAGPRTYVNGWHMLGPFDNRPPAVESRDVDLEKEWNGRKWVMVGDRFYRGAGVDLGALCSEDTRIIFYKKFNAEEAFETVFTLGHAGNHVRLVLNGENILGNIGRRGRFYGGGHRSTPVPKGRNEIMAYVSVGDLRRAGSLLVSMTAPLGEAAEMSLASQLRKAKLWANDGNPDHADAAYDFLYEILNREPPQRMNMDVMETMVRALIGRQDHRRALVLSDRLLRRNPREVYERALLWGQVQIRLGLGEMDKARGLFKRLNRDFPYSEETLKAREAIIKWYKEEKKRKEGAGKER